MADALHTVTVSLPGGRSYDVLVGAGARHRLLEVLPVGARRAAVVTQAGIDVTVDAGVEQRTFLMPDGEAAKCLETVEELCRAWVRWGLTRADVVVAVGGGVVTDTAGFAAAVHHRGVAVVHVPTTLLGQVDAAIGGKTGVNLPEGKNLVGAFWQPAAVLCDVDVLATLPPREYRSGLGEMAKYAFLGVDRLPDLPLDEAVAACVRCKAAHIQADELEQTGTRALLNYGHTLAHALETAGGYDLRHGEAVAIGLVFAARLARRLGRVDDDAVAEHLRVVAGYDLPTSVPPVHDPAELVGLMARDKKAVDGLTFVLDGPRGVEVVAGVDPDVVEATLVEAMVA
jgi:5-deoxy-5-amino-3-dehydroquinate synthase